MKDHKKIDELIKNISLEEKISMIHGCSLFETAAVQRLGIPSLKMSDGPMGVRQEFLSSEWTPVGLSNDFVSYLPSNMAVAATWNIKAAGDFGSCLGMEARGRGKDIILAPGINIIRSPLCGRNFEYMSEDPLLVSKLVVPLIKGIQQWDVAACVKHFIANNQEYKRLSVSVNIDEQALHEIYLPGFKAAVVDGGSMTVMSAYNRFRGEFCSESRWLLTKLLREEWGFDGVVISDWGAVHDTEKAAESGLDIEMDVHADFNKHCLADKYMKAIRGGSLSESSLDTKITNILRLMVRLKVFDQDRKSGQFNSIATRQKALEIARESIVLLKNKINKLPLERKSVNRLLVIGDNAERTHSGGGGSAEIKSLFEISPLLGITMAAGGNVCVEYLRGYSSDKSLTPGEKKELREEAIERAKTFSGEIIFVSGLNHDFDTEEFDRQSLNLPYEQDILIDKLLAVRPEMIIVNISGSPVAMPWLSSANSLFQLFYSGMFSGQAVGEAIFGDINPSGKLPVTFPASLEESPAHRLGEWPGDKEASYNEGVLVGYRYNDSMGINPLFAFGHGLSYSSWEYGEISLSAEKSTQCIRIKIRNTSKIDGNETVQLYAEDLQKGRNKPFKELRDFKKIFIRAGETKTVEFRMSAANLLFYDLKMHKMQEGSGNYQIHIGSSSADIRRSCGIYIA